ncbi:MAG: ATP-binding cassette domain-containing protein [Actinomycetota bacterium]
MLAVRGASLALHAKDFVALMGPSGSGKTTFIGVMTGLDRPDEGEVTWAGRPIGSLSDDERRTLRRTDMGVVFQSFGLCRRCRPWRTSSCRCGSPACRSPRRASARAAGSSGSAWPTAPTTGRSSLGRPTAARVAVARALIAEPTVVLADEPIAEVDTENADLILDALWDVIRRGGAVLAATHNPEALRYANRVVLFHDGVVQAEGTPEELAGQLTTD